MITNFEEITQDLSDKDLVLLPIMINGLKSHTEKNPIKAPEIVKSVNDFLKTTTKNGKPPKFSEPKLRKFVNHIRKNALLPLCATPAGYFVTENKEMLASQVRSLYERGNSINSSADGLSSILKKWN